MKARLSKGISVVMFGACILATKAHAQMVPDADGDGMSDLWEGQQGFSITSGTVPVHQGPTADPDQDGWTNVEESEAGTDPNTADAPAGMLQPTILRHPQFESVVIVSWPSLAGKEYTLLASPDLISGTWSPVDAPVMGTDSVIEVGMETLNSDGTRPDRLFWRVAVNDVDGDGDNVSDWNEIQLGLNPNLADSDGDTLADGSEIQAGLNPGHRDTDLDGIPDNLDSAPLENAALADRDGANLSDSLNQGVISRWDFDTRGANQTSLVSTPATGPLAAGPIDIANTAAGWDGADNWPRAANGMPWACLHFTDPGSYAKVPATRLATSTQSWAMWVRFTRGTLDNSSKRRTLFSITTQRPSSGNTLDEPHIHCYLAGDIPSPAPTSFGVQLATPPDDSIVIATHWPNGQNRPDELIQASWPVPASLDDGHWHHLVIGFGGGKYRAYFDGAVIVTPANDNSSLSEQNGNPVPLNQLFGGSNNPLVVFGQVNTLFDPTIYEALGASMDRLRVYNRSIGVSSVVSVNSEAKQLYNQDIDRDGLFDRIEARSRFWRDQNQDRIDQQSETTFPIDPFHWDEEGTDHDRDGLTTHDEQNIHHTDPWKPDSDGDLMPDGWEIQYGLNPNSSTDAYRDSESSSLGGPDGLNNLGEYQWGTNPKARDTDLDGRNDGVEAGGGGTSPPSHPNDPRDGGQAVPNDQKLTIKIAVGDQSGSKSEDYVVECRRIDPETGAELHVYTVRSGGFGQYSNPAAGYSMFRKGDTYTFQLKWQGTKNTTSGSGSPSDGPDYDYTFNVEPQGDHGGFLIDSWHKQNGTVDVGQPLQGTGLNNVATDEAEFRTKIENRRVALVKLKVEWEEIAGFENLSDHVDPWTGETRGKRIFPCYKTPADTTLQAKVTVKVTGGIRGLLVYLKSFDIDDGTSEAFDRDFDTGNPVVDVNGKSGNDNNEDIFNTPLAGQFWEIAQWGGNLVGKVFNSTGKIYADFRVWMQPGDNYRIAVSALDSSSLNQIQISDATASGYLGPELSQSGGVAATSPLTVWRRLWVENDSMESIPVDGYGYKKNNLRDPDGDDLIFSSDLNSSGNTVFEIPRVDDIGSFENLENGFFVANGVSHKVIGTVAQVNDDYYGVVVPGDQTHITEGCEFRLYDDDDQGLAEPPLPRTNLVGDELLNIYSKAFIEVTEAQDIHNTNKIIQFYRNHPATVVAGFPGVWDDAFNLNYLSGSPQIWLVNLVAGYQPSGLTGFHNNEDGDPRDEGGPTTGVNPDRKYSVVYIEACRDKWDIDLRQQTPPPTQDWLIGVGGEIRATLAHEIAHSGGSEGDGDSHHAEGGIMSDTSISVKSFAPPTIGRLRKAEKWQE